MHAQHLGSTAVCTRVRCSCGHRAYFYRYYWQRRGYVICDACKSFILYHSLEVKAPSWRGCVSVDSEAVAGELQFYRVIERKLTDFIDKYDRQPEWLWAPQTQSLVREMRQQLALLEELRRQDQRPGRRAA